MTAKNKNSTASPSPAPKRAVDIDAAPALAPLTPFPMEGRPCYVVLDDWTKALDGTHRPGVYYCGLTKPKGDAIPMPFNVWLCSPLYVEAITADSHDRNYGRMLRFKNTRGHDRYWAMPMRMLAGDGVELRAELLGLGVELSPKERYALAEYLLQQRPDKHLQCVEQTGWADTECKAFVLPDTVIGPDATGVTYQSEATDCLDIYRAAGTLEGWRTGVAAMAVGNPMLALGICLAFSGPLLAIVRGESGGLHYVGESSTGKTSILHGACSVFGHPENYMRSWKATSNGLEALAATHNDSLLTLDEIKQCAAKDVDEAIYMIGNGQGKARAKRTGGGRNIARWRCSVMSNGEYSIATKLAEAGLRIHAGQQVRFIDLFCDGRAFAVWDTLHHYPDAKTMSKGVKLQAATHYGRAGRAFIERLAARGGEDTDSAELLAVISDLPEFAAGDSQEQRVAGRFALLATAGELATEYGITGWPEGEAIQAAAVGFHLWRKHRDSFGGKNAEGRQVVQAMLDFIDKHGDSRFSDATAQVDPTRIPLVVHNRAGYWRTEDCGRVYLFNTPGMREALKGYDFKRSISYLQEAGLMPTAGQDGKTQRQHKIQGTNARWYEVRPEAYAGGAV